MSDKNVSKDKENQLRRKLIKSTLAGGAVISTSIVPEKWKKPALDSVVLPSHALMTIINGS